ncbi:MAG: putative baseplate assembly protein [Acidobacteriaceae bacterium]|nr:putative baseplate assembly protein [Acidobacteriaceae bacterium]MBV9294953.1 putative baseplate assembly protein [Acidobacteriaceae bacterium]MBV9766553.1 putative baseplate assembly protein [Acidobacteriaceae bacterium]
MIYNCCTETRKKDVLDNPALNGINYLEVLSPDDLPQRTLVVHCLKPVTKTLTPNNVLITGGESITGITALWIAPANSLPSQATAQESTYLAKLTDRPNTLVVRTSAAGDFSPYTLRLVNDATAAQEDSFEVTEVLDGFDPQLAEAQFSFKVECPPYFDCAPAPCDCPPQLPTPPAINYLAKDYGSFRTIMLDRMNQLLPDWGATSEADLGIALAELISYVGDYLSYQQDAVATEAYINTARSRVSLRRHALLVDYHVHDGSNSRAWIQLTVSQQFTLHQTNTRFYTFAPNMPSSLEVGSNNEEAALIAGVVVFEPMQEAVLYPEHNVMNFYTWGEKNCCLPAGSTEATLAGPFPKLQPGDVLIFEEILGPQTGKPADADIRHRCAVRLTGVNTLVDPLYDISVIEIQWSTDDALPFPLCLSSTYIDSGAQKPLQNVSQAFGNVVLADQGLSFSGKPLRTVPQPKIFQPPNPAGNRCAPAAPVPLPVRYRPTVPDTPLTQAVPLPVAGAPITPDLVRLPVIGFATLTDANGLVSLIIKADDPASWPQYFGVLANENAIHPPNFDLAVVFQPTSASTPVVLESYPDLPDPKTAAQQLNSLSRFVQVPSSFTPSGTPPSSFPMKTTMLPNSGTLNLQDGGGNTYLVIQPTKPSAWPSLFGVLAQGNLENPDEFNLLVLYSPASGAVGVNLPVVAEQFSPSAHLISVETFSQEPNLSLSAYDLMHYDTNQALPIITLTSTFEGNSKTWTPEPDLLAASSTDTNFVVEIESNGTSYLRFGDDVNGFRPDSGTMFMASYRIGNGTAGNVGAGTIIYSTDSRIQSCTNPLPATGGTDPETTDQIRRRAPQAFMTQERAVTMADYERVTEMNSQVDNAIATLRWTGSWYTVFITAEPQGAGNLTSALATALRQNINRYRLAGQDIQLESPEYVPLQISLTLCVDPDYFQSYVRQSLMQVLGSKILPNGQRGIFYPDNFTFGQTVYLSPIYAAARTVAGVQSVTATVFAPQGVTTNLYLSKGEIPLGPFQIARMDNDPSFPNHGQLTLTLQGGK